MRPDSNYFSRHVTFTDMGSPHYVMSIELLRDKIPDPGRHPFNIPSFRNFERLELHPRCNFFIGENGSGKSTLVKTILGVETPRDGALPWTAKASWTTTAL